MTDCTQHPGDTYDEAAETLAALIDVTQLASFVDDVCSMTIVKVTRLMQQQMQIMEGSLDLMLEAEAAKQKPPKKKAAVGAATSV